MKTEWKSYKRLGIAEMTEVDSYDTLESLQKQGVSVSLADINNGSPNIGDMIARNPKNHNDKWLVANAYFKDNFQLDANRACCHNCAYLTYMGACKRKGDTNYVVPKFLDFDGCHFFIRGSNYR